MWPDFIRRLSHVHGEINPIADFMSRFAPLAPSNYDLASPGARPRLVSNMWGGEDCSKDSAFPIGTGSRGSLLPTPPSLVPSGVLPRVAMRRVRMAPASSAVPPPSSSLLPDRRQGTVTRHEFLPKDLSLFARVVAAQASMPAAARVKVLAQRSGSSGTVPLVSEKVVQGLPLLFAGDKLFIPSHLPDLVDFVLARMHNAHTNHAHVDTIRVLLTNNRLHLQDLEPLVAAYVSSCLGCQQVASPRKERPGGALIPAPSYSHLEDIFMDVGFLPEAPNPLDPARPFIGVLVTVEAASRYVQLDPITSTESSSPVDPYLRWVRAAGRDPLRVHTDGGAEFKGRFAALLSSREVEHDTGTAENSKGRGLVERAILTLQRALVSSIPQGQLAEWVSFLPTVERATNHFPHSGLGNISPWQYRYAERTPPALLPWQTGSTPMGPVDRLANSITAMRELADTCSTVASVHRAATSPQDPLSFSKGDTVLLSHARTHKSSLEQRYFHYEGSFLVTDKEVDSKGEATGWYTVREILANHSPSREVLGPPRVVVSSRLWPFDTSRTDLGELMLRKLPRGFGIPEKILSGPSMAKATQGRFHVKWINIPEPSWEDPAMLASTTVFQEFMASRRKGRAASPQGRPQGRVPRGPARRQASAPPARAPHPSAGPGLPPGDFRPHPPPPLPPGLPLCPWSPLGLGTMVEVVDLANPHLRPSLASVVRVVHPSPSLPGGGYEVKWASSSLGSGVIPSHAVSPLLSRRRK